jgi:uncharacterized membrane protein YsdA (DUF1294 family)
MNMAAAVAGAYAAVTLITFGLYAADKRAARRGTRRVAERTLQFWTLAGGFAGAFAGQWMLRHKTRHPAMILGAWLALILHAAAWGGWLSSA